MTRAVQPSASRLQGPDLQKLKSYLINAVSRELEETTLLPRATPEGHFRLPGTGVHSNKDPAP